MPVVCQNIKCPYQGEVLQGLNEGDYCPYCGEPLSVTNPSFVSAEEIQSVKPTLNLIHSSGQKIFICDKDTQKDEISLGRFDDSLEVYLGCFDENLQGNVAVDINLKKFPNSERVSRKHAFIRWDMRDNCYCFVDNGSANKSFINEQQVEAQKPYRLQSQDQLRLAHNGVCFTVEIIP